MPMNRGSELKSAWSNNVVIFLIDTTFKVVERLCGQFWLVGGCLIGDWLSCDESCLESKFSWRGSKEMGLLSMIEAITDHALCRCLGRHMSNRIFVALKEEQIQIHYAAPCKHGNLSSCYDGSWTVSGSNPRVNIAVRAHLISTHPHAPEQIVAIHHPDGNHISMCVRVVICSIEYDRLVFPLPEQGGGVSGARGGLSSWNWIDNLHKLSNVKDEKININHRFIFVVL